MVEKIGGKGEFWAWNGTAMCDGGWEWVLADHGGKDLWKRWVLSLEWNS